MTSEQHGAIRHEATDSWAAFEVASVMDHEVVVIE